MKRQQYWRSLMGTTGEEQIEPSLVRLRGAVRGGELKDNLGPLENWAKGEGQRDGGGLLAEEGPAGWQDALRLIEPALKRSAASVPVSIRTIGERLRMAVAAFTRPDGSLAFGPTAASGSSSRVGRAAGSFATKEEGVVRAALRDRLAGSGHLVALAHAGTGLRSDLELQALGRNWVTAIDAMRPEAAGEGLPARWMTWRSGPEGDMAEYRLKDGAVEVERMVVWLRGRRVLLVADAVSAGDGAGGEAAIAMSLATGVEAARMADGSGMRLASPDSGAGELRLIAPTAVEEVGPARGRLEAEGSQVKLRSPLKGSRVWLPLVVDGDPRRADRGPRCRMLTVTQERRIVGPDEASAFRLAWPGRTESLVVYRSLVPAERRVFLGYQTGARFVVGAFNRKGEMTPIMELGEARS